MSGGGGGGSSWFGAAVRVAALAAAGVATVTLGLSAMQERLIYLARRYAQHADYYAPVLERVTRISYAAPSSGRQTCFLLNEDLARGRAGRSVWIVFGGNAALALDMYPLVAGLPQRVLLCDYPGYGECEGEPSPATILESSLLAVEALRAHVESERKETVELEVNILGHSIGAAAGLQLAAALPFPVRRMVLLSPFTRMTDVVRIIVGRLPGLGLLFRNEFDNVRALAALTAQTHVSILHGVQDNIVPVRLGRQLSATPTDALVDYKEFLGGDHNNIFEVAGDEILQRMMMAVDDEDGGKKKKQRDERTDERT